MSPPRKRRRILIGIGLALALAAGAVATFVLTRGGDVSNPDVEFRPEPTPTPVPEEAAVATDDGHNLAWAHYGYSRDRRRYLPASKSLRPPFKREWAVTGRILLEFAPVIARKSLYLLKNNGALYAISKRTGRVRWRDKLGYLAASSPAVGIGRVFVTLLQRGRGQRAGRVVALSQRTGKILWSRPLATRSESSPLLANRRLYFGSEGGRVYALNARTGGVEWTKDFGQAIKGGLALAGSKLYFGDYGGRVHAIRESNGSKVWSAGTSGARLGTGAGNFYSTPAVAYGRVYIGNTDGKVYSFASDNGKLAWTRSTGGFVYASPAVAQVPGGRPTVYAGSYSGRFYALDARSGDVRWSHNAGGKISGGATIIGDIVYFANLSKKSTVGLGARTGRKVFEFGRGSFNPVVSDGRMIYLTGYSSLYALKPVA